jgi:hypothetical protein
MALGVADLLAWSLLPLGLIRYQIKNTRGYLAMHAFIAALVGLTYFLQGAYSGAFVSAGTFCAVGIQATPEATRTSVSSRSAPRTPTVCSNA